MRPHDPVDTTMTVTGARKSALHFNNSGRGFAIPDIVISIVTVVIVRIVSVIGIRIWIEEWEPKRVHEDKRSIVEAPNVMEAIVKEPMHLYRPWRKAWC